MITDADTTPPEVSVNSQVTATGDAHVDQQVGAQFISSVLHNANIYNTLPGDPPERQHDVARAHLDGGNPRRAEDIFGSLLANGHSTAERAYFYVLSVLSDRSFTEITARLSDEIRNALTIAAGLPKDEWWAALDVVDMLLRYAHAEFGDGTVAQEYTNAIKAFGALGADRQDEIDRHLNLIVSGAVQEGLTSERTHTVAAERMDGDRVGRAWKFFETNPRPPMKWRGVLPQSKAADWRAAILGCAGAAFAILHLLDGRLTVDAVLGLALIAVSGYLALLGTTTHQTYMRHAETMRAEFEPQPEQQTTKFDKLVDQCFRDGDPGGLWENTAGYRRHLKRRLQAQYGGDAGYTGELKWLITWHVTRASQQTDHLSEPSAVRRAAYLRIGGALIGVFGLAVLLAGGHVVALVLAAVGWWGSLGTARIVAVSRTRALLDRDAEVLLDEEEAEYRRWVQVLADRPSDAEMARWLILDKAYLVDDALRRANLRERDLVTRVVLTQRAPYARKGRVTDGPPRYEAYLVDVFLLTQYGMRTARTKLSLAEGDMRNEKRQMFPYDAVASASVTEKSIRTFLTDGCPSSNSLSERVFRLTLLNGTEIAEVKENPRATADDQSAGDDELVDALSTQSSGFDSALRILEAVATEGREWILRDRERKQRWARHWRT